MKKLFSIAIILALSACSHEPQPILYGKDACDFCKMTIMDKRFSSECMSKKGKIFKFDDAHCLLTFLKVGGVWSNEVAGIYFSDYMGSEGWINSDKAFFLKSQDLKSPMGGNIAAFSSKGERDTIEQKFTGEKLSWVEIKTK